MRAVQRVHLRAHVQVTPLPCADEVRGVLHVLVSAPQCLAGSGPVGAPSALQG